MTDTPLLKSKFYCFTLNNPTDEEFMQLCLLGESMNKINYLIFGHETGGEHLIEHLQGYIECKNQGMTTRLGYYITPNLEGKRH